MNLKNKKIIIAAGGTAGHVFPAVCVARLLKKDGFKITFVTDRRGLKYTEDFKAVAIIQNIRTNKRAMLYASIFWNTIKSVFYLLLNRPCLSIGFGGYPSVPMLLSSQALGIKTIIHEQNSVIGKANNLLSKFAKKVLTSFEATKRLDRSNKIVCIGNPTRYESDYANVRHDSSSEFTFLIFGGSQGARVFAYDIVDVICKISKRHKIRVFHQGRKEDLAKIKERYLDNEINAVVRDFFDNMKDIYEQSDLVISRSGASTLFEIIGFQKPSILIPFNKSFNKEQLENAKILEEQKSAIIVSECDSIKTDLMNKIEHLLSHRGNLSCLSKNLKKLHKDYPSKAFADVVKETVSQ